MGTNQQDEVNTLIAALLSFVIVGLGHIAINKQTNRGALWFGIAVAVGIAFGVFTLFTLGLGLFFAPALIILPIGSGVDAYLQAEKINSGEVPFNG